MQAFVEDYVAQAIRMDCCPMGAEAIETILADTEVASAERGDHGDRPRAERAGAGPSPDRVTALRLGRGVPKRALVGPFLRGRHLPRPWCGR